LPIKVKQSVFTKSIQTMSISVRRMMAIAGTVGTLFLANGCKKAEDVLPEKIDPANASQLSRVLVMPSGTQSQAGEAPQPTTTAGTPTVVSNNTELISSNGSTVPLSYRYSNVSGTLAGFYVQVVGADRYFRIPFTGTSSASGRVSVPVGLPTNVIEGTFRVALCVYDNNGRVSAPAFATINVLELGTGAIQVSLSWDDTTDQDLYVTDPGNNIIYYNNSSSPTGGELDRDDTNGFGPENIFWLSNAPDGRYQVQVNAFSAFSSGTPTNFYVTVNYPGGSRSFTGTTSISQRRVTVTTMTKSGNTITFQ
jgi:hypothetical protein